VTVRMTIDDCGGRGFLRIRWNIGLRPPAELAGSDNLSARLVLIPNSASPRAVRINTGLDLTKAVAAAEWLSWP